MMTGYNDPGRTVGASVDAIMAEARSQGIKAVIWLTMRRAEVAYPGRDFNSTSLGFDDNADQVGVVLSGVSITPPAPWTRLRLGSLGRRVAAAQRVLIDDRIPLPGGADGIYGPYTEAAVEV
jgi:hypothetical protein